MACKVNAITSYFTAVVVLAILILVTYNVVLLSSYKQTIVTQTRMKDEGLVHQNKAQKLNPLDLIPKFRSRKDSLLKQPPINEQEHFIDKIPKRQLLDNTIYSEDLNGEDLQRFEYCESSMRQSNVIPSRDKCNFLDSTGREAVALVSFPGSGNTWIRGLLEELTGVCTGAVYCDISLRAEGFSGEFIRSGSVLVVKTHRHSPIWTGTNLRRPLSESEGKYGSAVFVVRNPFKALVAEWNRIVANGFNSHTVFLDTHVKQAGEEWFGENSRWAEFVHGQARKWFIMIYNWIHKNRHQPLLLIKYEQLRNNKALEMHKILKFLDIKFTIEEVQTRIDNGFSTFHRRKNNVTFEHFTIEQKRWVNSAILNATALTETLDFREYLINV